MNATQKRNILDSLNHAVESIVASWSCERGASLMDALSDLHVVKGYIEEEEPVSHKKKPADDDGPSVGDVTAARDVHASDDVVGLARAMQQKRHGGSQ